MAVPTTNVTFSSIQTEFGGSNPISASEYVRGSGAGYVPSNQATSATDGRSIPTTAINIAFGMFRGLTKTSSGGVSSGYSGTTVYGQSTSAGAGSASASVTFGTNGANTATASPLNFGNTFTGTSWYSPNTTGVGSSYWIRATSTGGFAPTGTYNTWLQLSSAQTWTLVASTSASTYAIKSGTVTFDISTTSNGSNIVATGSVSFTAERYTGIIP